MVLYSFSLCYRVGMLSISWRGIWLLLVYVFGGMVEISWNDDIGGSGFPVNLKWDFLVVTDGDIWEIDMFIPFWFCSKS